MFTINSDRDHSVVSKLTGLFNENIVMQEVMLDILCITVHKDAIHDVLLFLRDDDELQYNFLTTLCGMHYPETGQLGVVYHLHSFINNHRIRIKTNTSLTNPVIPSATDFWPSANWMERETYDFYGILFEGHPNLKRILNVDDMTDFPMRKEFPLEDQTREDKEDGMFGR
ncbi:MAG: NADH-quinone oxidoreductase subunit C [Bacteroidia bacterium]|nr:NADH-quinone oxidoreductase subunit C [Bacteroidia bacterium]